MKDNWIEMLFNLFEQTFNKLREKATSVEEKSTDVPLNVPENSSFLFIKAPSEHGSRVYSDFERLRLTNHSFQFLVRLSQWQIIPHELFEMALEHLFLMHPWDEIELSQTKQVLLDWFIDKLSAEQYAFLELAFQQPSDGLVAH